MSDLALTSFPLRASRVHEAGGPSAICLAAAAAAPVQGSLWIREKWLPGGINPDGMGVYVDQSSLLLAQTANQTDSLGVAEEALRDGSLPLVVITLTAPIGLTVGRRLQLAAQAGNSTGLCLIGEGMGSNAAETRWECAPAPVPDVSADDAGLQLWQLLKNKSGTTGAWLVRWDPSAMQIVVVSKAAI